MLARVVTARDLDYVILNVAILLVLVDLSVYCMCPQIQKILNGVCEKMKKIKAKNEHNAQKGAELKFCTRQYLYNSE